jgi:hypothetical protein
VRRERETDREREIERERDRERDKVEGENWEREERERTERKREREGALMCGVSKKNERGEASFPDIVSSDLLNHINPAHSLLSPAHSLLSPSDPKTVKGTAGWMRIT